MKNRDNIAVLRKRDHYCFIRTKDGENSQNYCKPGPSRKTHFVDCTQSKIEITDLWISNAFWKLQEYKSGDSSIICDVTKQLKNFFWFWLRFLTWMILQLPVCCHIPPLTKYTRFLCLLLISIITSEFLSHKAPGKIPWIIIQTLDANNHREIKRFLFLKKRLTLNVTAECIRKSQAKFIGSLPLEPQPGTGCGSRL